MANYTVRDNKKLNRFEIEEAGKIAFLQYELNENSISFLHTDVPEELGGKGVATALADYAFSFATHKSLRVKNYCAFIQSYIERHPELKVMTEGNQ